jgi:hypothetical protein
MSSAIEEEEADLRDGLRGLPLGRIIPVEDGVRWIGGLEDLGVVTKGVEVGEDVGKGTEGGSTGSKEIWGGGGGEGSCWSWSSSFGMWKRDLFEFDLLGRELRGAKAPGPRSLEKEAGEREAT